MNVENTIFWLVVAGVIALLIWRKNKNRKKRENALNAPGQIVNIRFLTYVEISVTHEDGHSDFEYNYINPIFEKELQSRNIVFREIKVRYLGSEQNSKYYNYQIEYWNW